MDSILRPTIRCHIGRCVRRDDIGSRNSLRPFDHTVTVLEQLVVTSML